MINMTFYHDAIVIKSSEQEYKMIETFLILHDMQFSYHAGGYFTVFSPDYLIVRDILKALETIMYFEERNLYHGEETS